MNEKIPSGKALKNHLVIFTASLALEEIITIIIM
jgi:hypothetical protein